MGRREIGWAAVAIMISGTGLLAAQGGTGAGTGASDNAIFQQAASDDVITADHFDYAAKGRRDPFEPTHIGDHKPTHCGPGVHGMNIAELDLQGIVFSGDEKYALVEANDKGYNLREGDTLCDGFVKTIEKDRVIFYQKNTDPLDFHPTIPVVKKLEPVENS